MAQPVWTLSVDLQTKTAVFTSGLADAAKGARGSFNDIKQDAQTMGRSVNGSVTEARHGVMLLGEEFGIHLPRALTSFIASIGPVGAAMEAAFPFLAILVGATLLIEHLSKLKEAGQQLTESQLNFGTVATNTLNGLNDKLLQAGIKADELNHDHIAALHKQIELIDHQSMSELVRSFSEVSKAADAVLTKLDTHWYSFDAGSTKAKASLEDFRLKYDQLIAAHNETGAADFLAESVKSQQKILDLQKQANTNQFHSGQKGQHTDAGKFEEAKNALKEAGYTWDQKELAAQQTLVDALRDQLSNAQALAAIKKLDTANVKQADHSRELGEAEALAAVQQKGLDERIHIEGAAHKKHSEMLAAEVQEEQRANDLKAASYRSFTEWADKQTKERAKLAAEAGKESALAEAKQGELVLAAEEEHAHRASALRLMSGQEQLSMDESFANRSYEIEKASLEKQLAALDTFDLEYANKQKTLQDKQVQLEQQHHNKIQQLQDQAANQEYSKLTAAQQKTMGMFAQGFSQVLMGHESFAKMMTGIGDQIASGMIENAIKSILADDMTKEHDAAAAARKMFLAGTHFPFPANIIMAPALGAMAFASVMAFESGGIVPGVGRGDTVPAMLEPGEGVLNNKQMDAMSYRAKFGGESKSGDTHVHIHSSPTIHALDSEGMSRVLDKHSDTLARHFNNHVRKMNR